LLRNEKTGNVMGGLCLLRFENQGCTVHTVTQSSWLGPIWEHVAKMTLTFMTPHLAYNRHAQ
jgi:hypothetical protein